jgi:hypothetical protein
MLDLRRAACLAAVLGVVVFAACDGDDGSTEEYAKRLDRVCTAVERELRELDSTRVESPGETAALIDEVIAKSRQLPRRVKAIDPPEGDDGEVADRFVRTLEREVENDAVPALEDLRDAVSRGDQAAAARAGDRLRGLDNSKSDRYARELGADACAS